MHGGVCVDAVIDVTPSLATSESRPGVEQQPRRRRRQRSTSPMRPFSTYPTASVSKTSRSSDATAEQQFFAKQKEQLELDRLELLERIGLQTSNRSERKSRRDSSEASRTRLHHRHHHHQGHVRAISEGEHLIHRRSRDKSRKSDQGELEKSSSLVSKCSYMLHMCSSALYCTGVRFYNVLFRSRTVSLCVTRRRLIDWFLTHRIFSMSAAGVGASPAEASRAKNILQRDHHLSLLPLARLIMSMVALVIITWTMTTRLFLLLLPKPRLQLPKGRRQDQPGRRRSRL